jgi:hypothetical protein
MPKILYLVTEDWFFVSHFLPMAQAARDCGLQVAVATRVRAEASNALTIRNALLAAHTLIGPIFRRIGNLAYQGR